MAMREVQITFDSADPGALAAFWCEALGYRLQDPPPGFDTWDAALDAWGVPAEEEGGPRLFFQRVPEGKTAKNRVHLDVRAAPGLRDDERMAALAAEADRLVSLGARVMRRLEPNAIDAGTIVMQDPEGNEFCLD